MIRYVYPKLPSGGGVTTSFFRLSGNGLANCLFNYAKAISIANKKNARIITPTWFNICIGPYIRHELDKRHYLGLFNSKGEISGINKLIKLSCCTKQTEVVCGLGMYFEDFLDDAEYVSQYIESHVCKNLLCAVNDYDFSDCIAIHVRLGDYGAKHRVPLSWYINKIKELSSNNPKKFLLFSDGTDMELKELTNLPNVQRVFFGNAIADIFAISRCEYLIGSDSTFSGWGAFLGQVPCVFYRKHYGRVLMDASKEIVENSENVWI